MDNADNLWLIEELYAQYLREPQAVEADWRHYFASQTPPGSASEPAAAAPSGTSALAVAAQMSTTDKQVLVDQLIRAYRTYGHLVADIDPLKQRPQTHPELQLQHHGLSEADLDCDFSIHQFMPNTPPHTTGSAPQQSRLTLRQIVTHLRNTYCRTMGVQFMHIDALAMKDWVQTHMEATENNVALSRSEQVRILTKLTDAETWETFVHRKFLGARRFSLEGAESLIPLLDTAIEQAALQGVEEMVIGMAHRGRLNVLVNILGKSAQRIFAEFDDHSSDPRQRAGDVKYHLGHSSNCATSCGRSMHLSLCFNPSHLEFVGPVAVGRVRAKQDRGGDVQGQKTLPIIIHGDAAFAGQGVTQEILNMSDLPGYSCGGSVHIIVNNQVGFTTPPAMARSTVYATDVARMLDIPIFHVNGEDPEGVTKAIRLALAFRTAFRKDVVIDMYCYRRLGHNEGDEPTFTQPVMYQWINKQPTVREVYLENLVKMGGISRVEAEAIVERCRARLEKELALAKSGESLQVDLPVTSPVRDAWQPYCGGRDDTVPADIDSSVPLAVLQRLSESTTKLPEHFQPHPKITRLLEQRLEMGNGNKALDWGAAEILAYASLLHAGVSVRLSGQDSGRGTFSHRHAMLHDHADGKVYVPLQHLPGTAHKAAGRFGVWDSPLSEVGVLGFDYGYSIDYPEALVVWEAQYGDFANGAQVIIDQFIATSEQKWNRLSGLVMLLPHGFEGAGPEHSSARLERFLSLAANDNMQVVQPTTPAQLFHLLRRQVYRKLRKPLIVMSPKSLLRHPAAVSQLQELSTGSFCRVLADPQLACAQARKVVLCSGKIYYDLMAARQTTPAAEKVALVRIEQLYPNPEGALEAVLQGYPVDKPLIWVQEEPRNMGGWPHLNLTYGERLLNRWSFSCVARDASASPATGSGTQHKKEQASLVEQALR